MKDEEIKTILGAAVSKLQANDTWLLAKNLSEQSVSHKLAEYLQIDFAGNYNVDCEYNGDINDDSGKKRIMTLFDKLEKRIPSKHNKNQLEVEILERAVFPDIIVHKRGDKTSNLLIIEVKKKSRSNVSCEYDREKLCAYTGSDHGNHLKYQLGAFILIDGQAQCKIEYYKDGKQS